MEKQKKQLLMLIAVVSFGFMYAYIQFLLTPQWGVIKGLATELSVSQAHLERLEESDNNLSTLKQNVVELTMVESDLKERIPTGLDKPDIMMTIYSMAKENDLSSRNLSFEGIREENQTFTMGMAFSCTGSRDNINTLVEQFHLGSKYIFVLESISYSSSEEVVSSDMRLVAYALNI